MRLGSGWENWSWADVELANSAPVHTGSRSIRVTAGAWEALYLHHAPFAVSGFTNITLWIHGGATGGQRLRLQAVFDNAAVADGQAIGPLAAGTWQQLQVPMSVLVPPGQTTLDGIWMQDVSGSAQPAFYIDELRLMAGESPPAPTNQFVTVRVDPGAGRKAIRPEIYGVAFADTEALRELNVPLNRSGGNATTRYNWQANASNRGSDWYFESLASSSATPGADGDAFIAESRAGGAEPMLTIPMIGWVAKLGPNRGRLCSFSIAKYGAQTDSDWQWFADAGNGISTATEEPITGNDPEDANLRVDAEFQAGWVRHLTNRWGTATAGGLRYYILDNEWSLWHETHRDVQPVGATMDEVRDRFLEHAAMIKAIDPEARIVGPEEWGWSGYLYSGYDLQWGGTHGWGGALPDRTAHGGMDFLPWFLGQVRQRSEVLGMRLLDLFAVHYYPQGGEFGGGTDTAMQLRRNRSTRSLWDPNYTDETWINDQVQLIPRLKQWVADHYPGTPVGITEYSWGAENHINGATTQADLLGIFGREGLDLATRWVVPGRTSPTFKAFQMYRNYDGARSTFGENSVAVTVPDPDQLSAFAAERSADGALTIMAINKVLTGSTPVEVVIAGEAVSNGTVQAWQLTAANAIVRLPDMSVSGGSFTNLVPAQSVTLFVVPSAAIPLRWTVGANGPSGQSEFWLEGQVGRSTIVESSTDLSSWVFESNQTLVSGSARILVPNHGAARFIRARLVP